MKSVAFAILIFVISGCAQQGSQSPSSTPKAGRVLQGTSVYVAVFSARGTTPSSGSSIGTVAHAEYWKKIRQKCELVLAGAVDAGPWKYVAVYQSEAHPLKWSDAVKIARAEPSVKKKLWSARVFAWNTALLSNDTEYDPQAQYFIGLLSASSNFEPLRGLAPVALYQSVSLLESERKYASRLAKNREVLAFGLFQEQEPSKVPDCPMSVSIPYSADNVLKNSNLTTNCGGGGSSDGEMRFPSRNNPQGMFIIRAETLDRAQLLQAEDPAIQAGRFSSNLSAWKLTQ